MLISSSAFGWLGGFDYRKPITINSTTNISDYQKILQINHTVNMLSNFDDIRFADVNDNNLNYWIEDQNNGTNATVWIKTDVNTTGIIYMYYGNSTTITSQSNAESIFILYDDFLGVSINTTKWTVAQAGYITVSNSIMTMNKGTTPLPALLNKNIMQDVITESYFQADNAELTGCLWFRHPDGTTTTNSPRTEGQINCWNNYASGYYNMLMVNGLTKANNATYIPTNAWAYRKLISYGTNITSMWYLDNTFTSLKSSQTYIDTGGLTSGYIGITPWGTNKEFKVDWIKTRKYTPTEPTYTVGVEESSGNNPPTITLTTPTNTTYYTSTINLTVQANDTDSISFSCNVTDDNSLIITLTDDSTYSANLTKTGGNHNITVSCVDADSETSTETVYYYVWSGLNISAYYSDSGNLSDNWDIYITNGTDNFSNLSNNGTVMFEWDTIPTGNINITINETNSTLYYMNATTNTTINNSLFLPLNITLTAKTNNPIILTSSLGLSMLEGQLTTISCSSPEGPQTVSINEVYVANPYILTVGTGLYDLLCQVPETLNYKPTNDSEQISVNALFSCTTSNTYAFEKNITTTGNITTLNFTDAVSQNILKSDLSDVNVSGVIETWVNFTNGYYVIVNNTGTTDLNIRFGNYYANNTYSSHNQTTSIYEISGYTQTNQYQIYNLLDELTGEFIYPPNSSIMVITSCSQGETYINIAENDTKFLIATNQYINKTAVRVTYTADAYYSRQLYPAVSDALILKFYLADAFVNAIDRIDFIIQDQNYYTSKLQVYKTLDIESIIITEGYFDASRQFSTYLQEDIDYYLRANDDGSLTDFGRITVVAPDTKYLGLISMKTSPDVSLMANHITSNFYTGDNYTKLYIYYNDDLAETINATITTYFENGTIFQTYYSAGIDTINIEYNISSYPTTSFYVTFYVWHETFGNSPLKWSQNTFFPTLLDLGISSFWYGLIGLAILMIVALVVSSESVIGGSLIFIIMILILTGLSWINISFGVICLIIFLLLLGVMKDVNRGRF